MASKAVVVGKIVDEPNTSLATFEANFQNLLTEYDVAEDGKILISLTVR